MVMKLACIILSIFITTRVGAVEIVKINPLLQVDGSTQFELVFEGRMVAPPYFVPFHDSVAIKWPNANNALKHALKEIEIKNEQDALLIVFKNNFISPSDLSKMSLKLTGNTVKTSFPQNLFKERIKTEIKKNDLESAIQEAPSMKVESIEKKSPELVKNSNPKKGEKDSKTNEDYLSYLLSSVDKDSSKNQMKRIPDSIAGSITNSIVTSNTGTKKTTSIVNIDKSFDSKEAKTFSSYLLRIFLVLTFIVGVILLLAKASKKIMIGKNKLGFLNNSKVVEILNTTYIAPKRQLLLVKVHDQVMLIANSEAGMSFISEIKDLSNILKNAEVEVAGSNFDTNMNGRESATTEVILKDSARIYESTQVESKTSKMRSVLKNKAKSLKAWQ